MPFEANTLTFVDCLVVSRKIRFLGVSSYYSLLRIRAHKRNVIWSYNEGVINERRRGQNGHLTINLEGSRYCLSINLMVPCVWPGWCDEMIKEGNERDRRRRKKRNERKERHVGPIGRGERKEGDQWRKKKWGEERGKKHGIMDPLPGSLQLDPQKLWNPMDSDGFPSQILAIYAELSLGNFSPTFPLRLPTQIWRDLALFRGM